jgi:3,4-dihydroxy-2-butanone 4-phosphate synthase
MKTSELTEAALDWAVAKCEGIVCTTWRGVVVDQFNNPMMYSYDWSQAGPIIEREGIALRAHDHNVQQWSAEPSINTVQTQLSAFRTGPTPLIAAMRCYVASQLGDEVEIPKELT